MVNDELIALTGKGVIFTILLKNGISSKKAETITNEIVKYLPFLNYNIITLKKIFKEENK